MLASCNEPYFKLFEVNHKYLLIIPLYNQPIIVANLV